MPRCIKIQQGETLHEWIGRISEAYGNKKLGADKLRQILRDVSVVSYVHGSNDFQAALEKR